MMKQRIFIHLTINIGIHVRIILMESILFDYGRESLNYDSSQLIIIG